jgi:hypothetical protein
MRKLLTFALLITTSVNAQEPVLPVSRMEQPASIDYFTRLGVDYLIKDNPTPNQDVIRSIPFPEYEKNRHATMDLEIPDPVSGYVIILFSEEKCRLNKQQ